MNRRLWMGVIEAGLWALVVAGCLAFLAVKLRNWEPLDRMPQDDFAMLYTAATVAQLDPGLLYQPERWNVLTGLDLRLPGPFPYAPYDCHALCPLHRPALPAGGDPVACGGPGAGGGHRASC